MKPTLPAMPSSQQGAVLLEAMIAILIFSMGILAIAGLQGAMIKNTSDAKFRAEATFIAQQKLGEIWTNAKNYTTLADYVETDEPIAQMPDGLRNVTVSSDRVVTVTVAWTSPGEAQHTYSTNARIEGIY